MPQQVFVTNVSNDHPEIIDVESSETHSLVLGKLKKNEYVVLAAGLND